MYLLGPYAPLVVAAVSNPVKTVKNVVAPKVTMYDSIDLSQIPADAEAVAGYVNGKWQTFPELAKRFPHARRVSVDVLGDSLADYLDIEQGDATVSNAYPWWKAQKARGAALPGFYTSASNIEALVLALAKQGVKRAQYRLWSANYTGVAHIDNPKSGYGITVICDGTQYDDKALGRNLDVSLCSASFFPPAV